jgi:hypothetical protein
MWRTSTRVPAVIRKLLVLCLAFAVAGCTSTPPPPGLLVSPPAWTEPASYHFVVDRKCGDQASLGRYRVTVANGEVTGTARIDGKTAAGEEEIEVLSLGDLLDLAKTADEDGAEATISLDPSDGRPTEVRITRDTEECFVISEYAAG